MKAQRLAAHGAKLDLGKNLSYGVQNSASNLIDEKAKVDKLAWEIKNSTSEAHYLVLSGLYDNGKNTTIFDSVANMLSNVVPNVPVATVWAFKDGVLLDDEGSGGELRVSSKTPGRKINQFLNYVSQSPTRVTHLRLKSVTIAGAQDLGNLDNEIKTMFFSPFAQPVEKQLPLAPLVKTNSNFSPNIMDVNFVDEAFPVILSNEHFLILQVNAGTILNITASIGAQDSRAQRHWRTIKNADDILRAEGI
jgi:hypothetical protein